ncbi:MAG: class I SAM-dependent methyltransferase [Verrucomicrobiota bacterium]
MIERDWYDTPLYYDIVFDTDTETEADFLEAIHRQHGPGGKSRRVLEPACGSGRLIREMARRGWTAAGFDLSKEMLEFSKKRIDKENLKAQLWVDRMEAFELPAKAKAKYDLAHCFVTTFKYLLTEEDAVACLQRVADALKPGGLFVLGLHLTAYSNTGIQHERWVAERDGIKVVCNIRSWPADREKRLEKVRSRIKATQISSGKIHQQETSWYFRTYNARQLRALIEKVPELELVVCHDFQYDHEQTRKLNDIYADIVLVLRKTDSN